MIDRYLIERVSIMGATVGLERTTNAGIAFGLHPPAWVLMVLIPLALIAIMVLAWKARRNRLHALCYGLIIGGAFGNIADRLNDGVVTDFIQIGWWPSFNVADSCITVGVVLLLLIEWVSQKAKG